MPDLLWTEVCDTVQETGIKTIPKKKNCKKAKWLPEEALQIAVKRRQSGWLLSKSLQATNAGEGVEKREPSYTVGGNAN